jgi:hypothetical protein
LKKQSQFTVGQIDLRPYLKGSYGRTLPCRLQKNKPNQTQFRRFLA